MGSSYRLMVNQATHWSSAGDGAWSARGWRAVSQLGGSTPGAAYVYTEDDGNWTFVTKLVPQTDAEDTDYSFTFLAAPPATVV